MFVRLSETTLRRYPLYWRQILPHGFSSSWAMQALPAQLLTCYEGYRTPLLFPVQSQIVPLCVNSYKQFANNANLGM